MMRKKNKFFLITFILLIGMLFSACTRTITGNTGADTGNQSGSTDELSALLTSVAVQTPIGEATIDSGDGAKGEGDGFSGAVATLPLELTPLATDTPEPPTATPQPTAPVMVVPASYTLHKGEHPYCLARRFNVDVDTLLAANNLKRDSIYPEGLTLTIPQNSSGFQGERALMTHPVIYTVAYDDTFYSIACRYGDVYPEEIAAVNGMTLNDTLTPGMELQIP